MRLQASISPHSRTKAGCEPKSVSWRCGSQTAAGELDNRTWRHAAFRTGGGRHGRAAPVLFHRLAEDAVPPLQGGLRALAGTRYTNKMPLTAVHLLDTDVVPFFVGHGVPVKTRAVGHGRDSAVGLSASPASCFSSLHASNVAGLRCDGLKRTASADASIASARRALPRRRPQDLVRDRRPVDQEPSSWRTRGAGQSLDHPLRFLEKPRRYSENAQ